MCIVQAPVLGVRERRNGDNGHARVIESRLGTTIFAGALMMAGRKVDYDGEQRRTVVSKRVPCLWSDCDGVLRWSTLRTAFDRPCWALCVWKAQHDKHVRSQRIAAYGGAVTLVMAYC